MTTITLKLSRKDNKVSTLEYFCTTCHDSKKTQICDTCYNRIANYISDKSVSPLLFTSHLKEQLPSSIKCYKAIYKGKVIYLPKQEITHIAPILEQAEIILTIQQKTITMTFQQMVDSIYN